MCEYVCEYVFLYAGMCALASSVYVRCLCIECAYMRVREFESYLIDGLCLLDADLAILAGLQLRLNELGMVDLVGLVKHRGDIAKRLHHVCGQVQGRGVCVRDAVMCWVQK